MITNETRALCAAHPLSTAETDADRAMEIVERIVIAWNDGAGVCRNNAIIAAARLTLEWMQRDRIPHYPYGCIVDALVKDFPMFCVALEHNIMNYGDPFYRERGFLCNVAGLLEAWFSANNMNLATEIERQIRGDRHDI